MCVQHVKDRVYDILKILSDPATFVLSIPLIICSVMLSKTLYDDKRVASKSVFLDGIRVSWFISIVAFIMSFSALRNRRLVLQLNMISTVIFIGAIVGITWNELGSESAHWTNSMPKQLVLVMYSLLTLIAFSHPVQTLLTSPK